MKNLVEKITCNKCNNMQYQEIEILNKEPIKLSDSNLSAVIVKKVSCKICSSSDLTREFIVKPEETKNAV